MAYKIVNDDSLTSVANAIRVKGEISGTLEFPDGFVSAIQNLSPSGEVTVTDVANTTGTTCVITSGSQPSSDIPLNTQLIDYTAVVSGYIVDASDGQESANEWSCCSDFTEIGPSMTFSYVAYQWYDMAFYDSSKTYISGVGQNTYADTIESDYAHGTLSGARIPSNAAYVRFSSYPHTGISSTQLSFIRTA